MELHISLYVCTCMYVVCTYILYNLYPGESLLSNSSSFKRMSNEGEGTHFTRKKI